MALATISCIQLALIEDEAANLRRCLELVDEAAAARPDLIILPEMANWSGGAVGSLEEALVHGTPVPGPFVDAFAERAERYGCHIVVGVIERLGNEAFITSVIVAPDRRILLKYQKQIPFGGQRRWATPGRTGNPIADLPFGRVGIYICADGLVPETTRLLALQGCQVLINTLHSGGPDETFLHVPARAVENRVWVASANKVGLRERGAVGSYCGGSQIVSPTGEIAARADDASEQVVTARIDPSLAEDKDLGGDDILALRRPACYGLLALPAALPTTAAGPATLGVAALQPTGYGDSAVEEALNYWTGAVRVGAKLVVLPGFFPYHPPDVGDDPAGAAVAAEHWLDRFGETARATASWAALSLVERDGERYFHTGYLIDHHGRIAGKYRQVHTPASLAQWASAGDEFPVFDTAIGRIGLLMGADILVPEAFRVLALKGAQLIAIPAQWRADYELDYVIPERAAENRVNIAFARRFDAPARHRGSAIVGVTPYPSEPHWKVRSPVVIEAQPDAPFVVHAVNLLATLDKTIGAEGCDLFRSARPEAYGPIVASAVGAARR